ncbi:MAG: hypothetical protein EA416_10735 [Trueperaceae bacterium]|nr:MAG: hypothetical protein EA416_10735 [Trueperaceae bacterium]
MIDPQRPAIAVVEDDPAWPAVFERVRAFPASVRAYGALKRRLAWAHPHGIDAYVAGKTDFVLAILRAAGFGRDDLDAIERVNRSPSRPPADGS